MKGRWAQIAFGLLATGLLVAAVYLLLVQEDPVVPLVTVANDIREGEVERVTIEEGMLEVLYTDGRTVRAQKEPESTLVEQLTALGVTQEDMLETEIVLSEPAAWKRLTDVFTLFIQLLLIGGLAFILFKKAPSLVDSSPFGGSKGRAAVENKPAVTFDDVAGVDEAKAELQEVVSFLKEPGRFVDMGARTPKGILLVGPPGTGKTLLAKAVAGESNVPFFNISASEFMEMFVGVGASRVRKLFAEAKKHSPSIIFIDEIDAVGRRRDSAAFSNNGEREQTLNQILVEIDGFDTETGVIVIAATNRVDVLDSALLRPGRFDRQVTLSPPDIRGREETFKVHLKGKPVDEMVSAHDLARATPGFVGADIENVVNEAAILAVRNGQSIIGMEEFDAAIERVMAGPEKRGRVISDHERLVVAYHETGHALVAHVSERCDPVKKVSLIPRGAAAGYTITMPEEDRYLVSCGKLKDDMAFILGGRAAEELIFGEVTTGASNDLMKATEIARRMVTEYGMSPNVGPLSYYQPAESPTAKNYSEAKAMQIDEEIKCLVEASYAQAKALLGQYRPVLEAIVQVLLVEETLSAEDFGAIFEEAMSRFPVVA